MARLSLLLAAGFLAGTVAAQESLAAVLGNGSLTGVTVNIPDAYSLRVVCNATHALYTLTFASADQVGWAGVGHGTSMLDMDSYLVWPSSSTPSANWSMSHRVADQHTYAPVPTGDSAADLAAAGVHMIPAMTSDTAVTFIRPLTLTGTAYVTSEPGSENIARNSTSFVYAVNPNRPSSDAYDATITMHTAKGVIQLDLATPFNESTAASSSSGVPVASFVQPWSKYDKIIVAHAALGSVAWLILAPAAILLGRFGRRLSFWFAGHRALQFLVAALTVIVFALGVYAVQIHDRMQFPARDAHKVIGLLIFILVLLQVVLGIIIHALFDAERTRRPLRNFAHIGLGITIMVLAFSQPFTGFREYQKIGSRTTPKAVVVISGMLVGLTGAAYLVGVLLLARGPSRGGESLLHRKSKDDSEKSSQTASGEERAGLAPAST